MSADFWAGYISGAIGILIGNPLDLIKVRLQAHSSATPAITARHPSSYTSQFSGATSLIRGATAPILGYGALNALLFMTYNRATALLTPETAQATLTTAFVAGAVGGLASWVVSSPTELIKCRAQMSTRPISSLSITREVLKTEGLRGLYYGGAVTAARDSIGYAFYFWSYELGSRMLAERMGEDAGPRLETAKTLLCGGVAGVVTWASVFPLDVVKTRVQTQTGVAQTSSTVQQPLLGGSPLPPKAVRLSTWDMTKSIYRQEGGMAFWRGLGVCSVRAFIVNAAQWAVYEWIMNELDPNRVKARAVAGAEPQVI
jgi:solute carrier family 25 carnitine/acylcarnitine transporter 20/29